MNIKDEISQQLSNHFPSELVDNLLENYLLVKERYYTGKYREASSYGGRYAEAFLRIIQFIIDKTYTPLGTSISNFHDQVVHFGNQPKILFHESIRLQIPKALDVLYDIRSKRDVGHLGGDINANYADATLSLTISSWTLAELIRIYYVADLTEAQKLVDNLIRIRVPIIQDFNGFLKILNPKLRLSEKIMVLAFQKGDMGVALSDYLLWLRPKHRISNIKTALDTLVNEKSYLHKPPTEDIYYITESGIRWTEENINFEI